MQNFEPFRASFKDGVEEGERLLALITEINPELEIRCQEKSNNEQLEPINRYLVERSKRYAYPYLEGFLSSVMKPNELESDLITFWGADEFVENQSNYAPVCEFEESFQIVQFAYMTGDGSAWCIDLDFQEIIGLSPSADGSTSESARRFKFGVFPAFDYLTSYLRTEAQRRGWLPKQQ